VREMKYQIENLSKSYDSLQVLDNISLEIKKEEVTCIMGPSGCGKTTLLNIIAGFIKKDSGGLEGFDDEISYVFQEDRLIPWKNVEDNISFVLKGKMDSKEIAKLTNKYLSLVGLEDYKNYYPDQLSGGMKQRISILRAFIYPSSLILLDEPFSNLDMTMKNSLIKFFKDLVRNEKRSVLVVTHDIDVAISLGKRIVVLSNKPTRVNNVLSNIYLEEENQENYIKMRKILERVD